MRHPVCGTAYSLAVRSGKHAERWAVSSCRGPCAEMASMADRPGAGFVRASGPANKVSRATRSKANSVVCAGQDARSCELSAGVDFRKKRQPLLEFFPKGLYNHRHRVGAIANV